MLQSRMIGRLIVAIVAGAAGIYSSSLLAQTDEESPRDEIIMNAWANPTKCNRALAKRVAFHELADDAEGLRGKCVAVEGYWAGRALFGSMRDANTHSAQVTKLLRGKRIGLYARWENIGMPPDRPTRTLAIGLVGQCETQWPGAMMVMGYCHYTGGPILLVAEVVRSSKPRSRLEGSD